MFQYRLVDVIKLKIVTIYALFTSEEYNLCYAKNFLDCSKIHWHDIKVRKTCKQWEQSYVEFSEDILSPPPPLYCFHNLSSFSKKRLVHSFSAGESISLRIVRIKDYFPYISFCWLKASSSVNLTIRKSIFFMLHKCVSRYVTRSVRTIKKCFHKVVFVK